MIGIRVDGLYKVAYAYGRRCWDSMLLYPRVMDQTPQGPCLLEDDKAHTVHPEVHKAQ